MMFTRLFIFRRSGSEKKFPGDNRQLVLPAISSGGTLSSLPSKKKGRFGRASTAAAGGGGAIK